MGKSPIISITLTQWVMKVRVGKSFAKIIVLFSTSKWRRIVSCECGILCWVAGNIPNGIRWLDNKESFSGTWNEMVLLMLAESDLSWEICIIGGCEWGYEFSVIWKDIQRDRVDSLSWLNALQCIVRGRRIGKDWNGMELKFCSAYFKKGSLKW